MFVHSRLFLELIGELDGGRIIAGIYGGGVCVMRKGLVIVLVVFAVLFTGIAQTGSANAAKLVYKVRPGDTFWLLSQRFEVSVGQIKAESNYWSNNLYVGQSLGIPVNGSYTNSGNLIYTVKSGDTLWKLSQKYGVSVFSISRYNNLLSDYLNVGDVLVLPTAGGSSVGNKQKTYTVQKGDTLWLIAQKYGINVSDITKVNNLTSDYLYVGQTLIIPEKSSFSNSSPANNGNSWFPEEEVRLLARIIEAEAGGESILGQVAVGAVVMNRVRSPQFPNTLSGVLYQSLAFESVSNGYFHKVTGTRYMEVARRAMAGEDPTRGALFFYNPVGVTSQWILSRKVLCVIGNHRFAI